MRHRRRRRRVVPVEPSSEAFFEAIAKQRTSKLNFVASPSTVVGSSIFVAILRACNLPLLHNLSTAEEGKNLCYQPVTQLQLGRKRGAAIKL